MPRARVLTSKFLTLSYYNPRTGSYGVGKDDGYLIFFFVVVLTLLRAALMEYVLAPFAKSQGITKRKPIVRFSEQGFLLFWGAFIFTLGTVRLVPLVCS
jgi:very-long-chain ceramide synthase